MSKKLLLSGAAASALLFANTAQAGFISIDEFTGPAMAIIINDPAPPSVTVTLTDNETSEGLNNGVANAGIIGDYRDMSTTVTFNDNDPVAGSQAFVSTGTGSFNHNQAVNTQSSTTMTWNGLAGTGLGADFSGLTGLEIGLLRADAGVDWLFTLVDGDGSIWTTIASTIEVPLGSPETIFLSFGLFGESVAGGTAGLDFSDIFSIQLTANIGGSADSFDTRVDYLRAVPEPMTIALFGLGLLGAGAVRRRMSR